MSEREIRCRFKERGYKFVRVIERNVYRVYSLKSGSFLGDEYYFFTLEDLRDIAETDNFLRFLAAENY